MDSGNSGSMQSSSGGDDEYDSRSEPPFAAFLSSNSGITTASTTNFSSSFAHHQQRQQQLPPSTFFDSLPSYLDSLTRSPPPPPNPGTLLNLDMSWSTSTQSCTDIAGSLKGSAPPPPPPPHPPLAPSWSSNHLATNPTVLSVGVTNPSESSSYQAATATTPRGSKKRPRASRRAPTTVLTTDTRNFRQMVQEFTGIPAPPFSSPAFPRTRFDLFNSAAAASTIRSSPGTSGLLRPFAQKMPTPTPNLSFGPFATHSSSTASGAVAANVAPSATSTPSTTYINTMTTTTTASGSAPTVCANPNSTSNYQLPTDLGTLANQTQSLMQSQLLAYQSLFQSMKPPAPSQNYGSPTVFGSKALVPTTTMPLAAASDQYSLSSGDTSASHTLTSLFGSERMASRGGGSSGSGCGGDPLGWGDGSGLGGGDQAQFRPLGGHYGSSSINGCKMNHTANSTSEYHAENRSDNVNSSRGEGTFDPWICSSD